MRDERRIQQREIGSLGEHALMKPDIVWQRAIRFDPDTLPWLALLRREIARNIDRPKLDGPVALPVGAHDFRQVREKTLLKLSLRGKGFRRRHNRHRNLMVEAQLWLMK